MGFGYLYTKRTEYLADPVLQRALMHLEKDQRVLDFCGETIKPGWLITREVAPGENWVKYSLTVSGSSGKLSTTLIGDYMEHSQLLDLEQDRQEYFRKREAAAKKIEEKQEKPAKKGGWFSKSSKEETKEEPKQEKQEPALEMDYVPVDFDAYSIRD